MVTRPVAITDQRRLGKIVNRNAMVSRSTTITSTKFTVICATSCLKRDSSTSTTTMVSDSAPDSAGRLSSASQAKFSRPQDRMKHSREEKSVSVWYISPRAATWGAATASQLTMLRPPSREAATAVEGPGSGTDVIEDANTS